MEFKLSNITETDIAESYFFLEKSYLATLVNVKIISVYKGNKFISYIPLEIKKKLIFKIGRLVYEPYPINSTDVLNGLVQFLSKEKLVDFLIATPNYIPFEFYPQNSIFCEFGTYRLDLTKNEEELFKGLHSKHRNVIRKCQKEGLKVRSNEKELIKECYDLFKKTMSRSKMDYPSLEYLIGLHEKIPENIYVSIVYHNDIPQGAIYLFYTKERAYYMYGGSIEKPFTGAMNYLHWNAINGLKQNGVKSYDFVGARIQPQKNSKVEGIQRFKERFGGDMYRGYMWKYIFNKPKYFLYIFALKLLAFKNRTKYKGDIIDQENML